MKVLSTISLLIFLGITGVSISSYAQMPATLELRNKLDSFERLGRNYFDTAYANTLIDLAYIYSYTFPDTALMLLEGHAEKCRSARYTVGETDTYLILGDAFQTKGMYAKALDNYDKSYKLALSINNQKSLPVILNRVGIIYLNQGNYPEALRRFYASLKAAEVINNKTLAGATLNNIAIVHFHQGKFEEAEKDYLRRLEIAEQMSDSSSMSVAYNGIGEVSLQKKDLVKAMQNLAIAHKLAAQVNDQEMVLTVTLSQAETFYAADSLQKAAVLFENALALSKQKDNGISICTALIGLAKVYNKQGRFNEALASGLEGLQRAQQMGQVQLMRDANEIVSSIYESRKDGINALKHYRLYKVNSDSLNNLASQRAVAIERETYEFSKKELEFERKTLQQRWLTFSAFAGLISLGILLFVIYRSRSRLNRTFEALQHKNTVIEAQRLKAEETLTQLKSAQAQLIQAEKMASLGELTAGIAHEIQNPLNFVNNFSEVSCELVAEMDQELDKGFINEARSLADDIRQNLEKIHEHGKRADAIVKGMLQHTRTSIGIKEPTDINKLADEYLRLAHHGWRAKDSSFNVNFNTTYDQSLGKINIIPQEIGRVLLNLINNALYAVAEKKKSPRPLKGSEGYEPIVTISTQAIKPPLGGLGAVLITISDNGLGIPPQVIDKIFQPFFTTRAPGEGTGLGLSLSYDIITAHGGSLSVETTQGEGSTFTISLPAAG